MNEYTQYIIIITAEYYSMKENGLCLTKIHKQILLSNSSQICLLLTVKDLARLPLRCHCT